MQLRQTRIIPLLILSGAALVLGAPAPGPERTTLCQTVTLRAPIVRLSDLLPSDAPSALSARAAEIVLGSAPQPGRLRIVSGAEIKGRLIDTPDLLGRLVIPERILIQRSHRLLSTSELLRAISNGLGGQGLPDSWNWGPNDLELSAPVYVTLEDPGLEVTRIEFDPLRRQTKFRLWTSKEPSILPFWVTVAYKVKLPTLVARHDILAGKEVQPADFHVEERVRSSEGQRLLTATDLTGLQARVLVRGGQPVSLSMFTQVVLIEPGKPAKLVAEGANFRASTTVIPLQSGVMGQQIRVREMDSQRILLAEVVARGKLKATL